MVNDNWDHHLNPGHCSYNYNLLTPIKASFSYFLSNSIIRYNEWPANSAFTENHFETSKNAKQQRSNNKLNKI